MKQNNFIRLYFKIIMIELFQIIVYIIYRIMDNAFNRYSIDNKRLGNQQPKISQPAKRSKQINGLHAQFEQLKKKIRDVQNKNEKIISKIHNAFNFKKKNTYLEQGNEYQYNARLTQPPANNYMHSNENIDNFIEPYNNNYHPNYTNQVDPRKVYHSRDIKQYQKNYNYENFSNENQYDLTGYSGKRSKSPHLKKKPQNQYSTQYHRSTNVNSMMIEQQRMKSAQLANELKQQVQRSQNIENKYLKYAQSAKSIVQHNFYALFENVIRQNLMQIQKNCKKNENRLKTLLLQIKQSHEQYRSAKVIRQTRQRRSSSRMRTKTPSKQQKDKKSELNKSRVQDIKKSKQFQQIAGKYENIIRGKTDQIEGLDKKLRMKQHQLVQLKGKLQNANKKLKQQQWKLLEAASTQTRISSKTNSEQQYRQKIEQSQILKNQIIELQRTLQEKDDIIEKLNLTLKSIQSRYEKSQNSKLQQITRSIEKLQKQIQQKNKTILSVQENSSNLQKKLLQKQCELFALNNKYNQSQQILQTKSKKIQELQKILRSNEDILDRSLVMDNSVYVSRMEVAKPDQYRRLNEEIQKLEDELQKKKNQNYSLTKQKDSLTGKIKDLEQKLSQAKRQNQMHEEENQISKKSSDIYDENDEQKMRLQQQLNEALQKCSVLTKTIQQLRKQNLEANSKYIKINSQLQFMKDNIDEKQIAQEKIKGQNEKLREKINLLQKKLAQSQYELDIQKKQNQQKIREIQKQWLQFEQQANQHNEQFDHKSQRSSIINFKHSYNDVCMQNQLLQEKIKQAQAIIDTQNIMQKRIIEQYKLNVEKVRTELKNKSSLADKLALELDKSRKKIIQLQAKQKSSEGETMLMERLQQLEKQLQQTKNMNSKLNQMSNELFEQIKIKQEEKMEIIKQYQQKHLLKIGQIQQIYESQQLNYNNNATSRVSSRSRDQEALRSQILKSSMYNRDSSQFHHQQSNIQQLAHERTIDFDLSVDQSMLSFSNLNVQQLFSKGEISQQKLKLRKKQHKLFQKTAAYIKSLKQVIQQKNKKITLLEKKIQSLKKSQLVRKDYDLSGREHQQVDMIEGSFKDYESQPDNARGGHHRRYRMLENDTKLVVQENNMLVQQIEALQEQIERAQEQQNSLVKIKDLYKDEIKKLYQKLQEQNKTFEEQIQKQRRKIEDSESIHNFEALKQLFIKMGYIIGVNAENKKNNEKKKELEQYIKVVCSILRIDQKQKDLMIANIKE